MLCSLPLTLHDPDCREDAEQYAPQIQAADGQDDPPSFSVTSWMVRLIAKNSINPDRSVPSKSMAQWIRRFARNRSAPKPMTAQNGMQKNGSERLGQENSGMRAGCHEPARL